MRTNQLIRYWSNLTDMDLWWKILREQSVSFQPARVLGMCGTDSNHVLLIWSEQFGSAFQEHSRNLKLCSENIPRTSGEELFRNIRTHHDLERDRVLTVVRRCTVPGTFREHMNFVNDYLQIYEEQPIRTITIIYDLVGLLSYLVDNNLSKDRCPRLDTNMSCF